MRPANWMMSDLWRDANGAPDGDGLVLVCVPDQAAVRVDEVIGMGYFDHEDHCWRWSDGGRIGNPVTHWMPLPDPPEMPDQYERGTHAGT